MYILYYIYIYIFYLYLLYKYVRKLLEEGHKVIRGSLLRRKAEIAGNVQPEKEKAPG